MRQRSAAELNDPARLERLRTNPYSQPRILRDALRELLAETGVDVIRDTLTAPPDAVTPADRLRALELAYKYGIGTQTGFVDGDGESIPGVIALPALEMNAVQADKAPLRIVGRIEPEQLDADSAGRDNGTQETRQENGPPEPERAGNTERGLREPTG